MRHALALAIIGAIQCVGSPARAIVGPWGHTTPVQPSFGTLNASTVSTGGGTAVIFSPASQFGTGANTPQVQLCLDPCTSPSKWFSATVVQADSTTSQLATIIPPLAAGNYDTVLSDLGGNLGFAPNLVTVIATSDPATIFTTRLIAWFRADSLSSSTVTTWADKSAQSNTVTAIDGGAAIWNASDPHFENAPSVSFNGTTSELLRAAFTIPSSPTPLTCFAAVYITANNTVNGTIADYSNINFQFGFTPLPAYPLLYSSGEVEWNTGEALNPVQIYGATATDGGVSLSVSNQAPIVTSTIGGDQTTGAAFALGAATTGTYYGYFDLADLFVVEGIITQSERNAAAAYLQQRYELNKPTFGSATPINTGGGCFRISGSGYDNGVVVTANGQGLVNQTLTVTWRSATTIEACVPSGSYTTGFVDLSIVNPDSSEIQAPSGLTIQTKLTFMSVFGTLAIADWEAGTSSLNETAPCSGIAPCVAGVSDTSLVGNVLTQATAADQPLYLADDARFANQASWQFNGTAATLRATSLIRYSATDLWFVCILHSTGSSTGGTSIMWDEDPDLQEIPVSGDPKAYSYYSGMTSASWGTSLTGTFNTVTRFTSASEIGMNVSNGAEVTAAVTTSLQATTILGTIYVGSNNGTGAFYNDAIALCGVLDGTPTSTMLTNFETMARTEYGAN